MQDRVNAYRKAETLGKSRLDLLIQVYDGAIAAFSASAEAYRHEDRRRAYDQLQRARRFVTHLYTTLDPEQGGEIADNLGKLYAFMLSRSYEAEATADAGILEDNVRLLRNLREGWVGLKERLQAEGETNHTEPVAAQSAELVTTG